jgi:hypothetical protein
MALIFIDGFESFGTTPGNAPTGLTNKWLEVGNHSNDTIIAGRYDGIALRPSGNSGTAAYTQVPAFTQTQTLVAGVAFRIETLPSSGFRTLLIFNSGSNECGVAVGSSGELRMFRSTSTMLEDSSAGLIDPNKWYYLEAKVVIANSGSWDVHLDGVQVLADSGDTQAINAFATTVRLEGRNTSSQTQWVHYDDFYVLDTSGSVNNDLLGPRHIVTLFPTAVGDSDDFTPTSGDNYTNVDDIGHDTDTSVVESSTTDDKDLYGFGDVPAGTNGIDAVAVYGIVRKTDVTAFDFIPIAKSEGVEGDGATVLVNSETYHAAAGIFDEDPDSSSPWTESGVNAAQFGFKVG